MSKCLALLILLGAASAFLQGGIIDPPHNRVVCSLHSDSSRKHATLHNVQASDEDEPSDHQRRQLLSLNPPARGVVALGAAANTVFFWRTPPEAQALNAKSRTKGYEVQKSDAEWKSQLSPMQYFILRQGGTESPGFSVLEGEKRAGVFVCTGCDTPLFESQDKFNSGTGWPSFARSLESVEVENVNPLTANLAGAELRCKRCGGHLGDLFNDGFLFVGTPAFTSGKRYCIDGAALVFRPSQAGEPEVRGDISKQSDKKELPSWLESPKITPQ